MTETLYLPSFQKPLLHDSRSVLAWCCAAHMSDAVPSVRFRLLANSTGIANPIHVTVEDRVDPSAQQQQQQPAGRTQAESLVPGGGSVAQVLHEQHVTPERISLTSSTMLRLQLSAQGRALDEELSLTDAVDIDQYDPPLVAGSTRIVANQASIESTPMTSISSNSIPSLFSLAAAVLSQPWPIHLCAQMQCCEEEEREANDTAARLARLRDQFQVDDTSQDEFLTGLLIDERSCEISRASEQERVNQRAYAIQAAAISSGNLYSRLHGRTLPRIASADEMLDSWMTLTGLSGSVTTATNIHKPPLTRLVVCIVHFASMVNFPRNLDDALMPGKTKASPSGPTSDESSSVIIADSSRHTAQIEIECERGQTSLPSFREAILSHPTVVSQLGATVAHATDVVFGLRSGHALSKPCRLWDPKTTLNSTAAFLGAIARDVDLVFDVFVIRRWTDCEAVQRTWYWPGRDDLRVYSMLNVACRTEIFRNIRRQMYDCAYDIHGRNMSPQLLSYWQDYYRRNRERRGTQSETADLVLLDLYRFLMQWLAEIDLVGQLIQTSAEALTRGSSVLIMNSVGGLTASTLAAMAVASKPILNPDDGLNSLESIAAFVWNDDAIPNNASYRRGLPDATWTGIDPPSDRELAEILKLCRCAFAVQLRKLSITESATCCSIRQLSETLELLDLSDCPNLTETDLLTTLPKLAKLTLLRLDGVDAVTDRVVGTLAHHLPLVQELHVSRCKSLTSRCTGTFQKFVSLKSLFCAFNPWITDKSLLLLPVCSLFELDISGSLSLTDAGIWRWIWHQPDKGNKPSSTDHERDEVLPGRRQRRQQSPDDTVCTAKENRIRAVSSSEVPINDQALIRTTESELAVLILDYCPQLSPIAILALTHRITGLRSLSLRGHSFPSLSMRAKHYLIDRSHPNKPGKKKSAGTSNNHLTKQKLARLPPPNQMLVSLVLDEFTENVSEDDLCSFLNKFPALRELSMLKLENPRGAQAITAALKSISVRHTLLSSLAIGSLPGYESGAVALFGPMIASLDTLFVSRPGIVDEVIGTHVLQSSTIRLKHMLVQDLDYNLADDCIWTQLCRLPVLPSELTINARSNRFPTEGLSQITARDVPLSSLRIIRLHRVDWEFDAALAFVRLQLLADTFPGLEEIQISVPFQWDVSITPLLHDRKLLRSPGKSRGARVVIEPLSIGILRQLRSTHPDDCFLAQARWMDYAELSQR